MSEDLGSQGGSVKGFRLDLSGCVNGYGPPPAALDALAHYSSASMRLHPFEAEDQLADAYAAYLRVPRDSLTVGRGVSGLLWTLRRRFAPEQVAIPLPAYTEFLSVFVGGQRIPSEGACHSVDQLRIAMSQHAVCLISNPHNPSGAFIERDVLAELALEFPACQLIVDESYLDFLPNFQTQTLVGVSATNVVVLRSPTKFFGIAAARVGVAWTRNEQLRTDLIGLGETWPLSGIDVVVATAALAETKWAIESRRSLEDDALWLDDWLHRCGLIANPSVTHFRLIAHPPDQLHTALAVAGVAVRRLSSAHGLHFPSVRIAAPTAPARETLSLVHL